MQISAKKTCTHLTGLQPGRFLILTIKSSDRHCGQVVAINI